MESDLIIIHDPERIKELTGRDDLSAVALKREEEVYSDIEYALQKQRKRINRIIEDIECQA